MSPSSWGPNTGIFMHTLAAKVKETSFPIIGPNLILILIQICNNLPCPECAQHARQFWNKVKTNTELPDGRDGHSACIVRDSMYIFGGYVQKTKKFSNDIYQFNFTTSSWTLIVPKVNFLSII